jgi:hypothetical protein
VACKGLGEECELIVEGVPLSATIDDEIVTVQFIGTTAGASTVTIKAIDPEKKLQSQHYFSPFITKKEAKVKGKGTKKAQAPTRKPTQAECLLVDEGEKKAGLHFEACSFKKRADEYELEFEDRDVAILREDKSEKVVAASRDNMTRAQFIEQLVHKAAPHIVFHSPNERKKQPIEPAKRSKAKTKSLPKGSGAKIEGIPLDAEQREQAGILLAVCEEHNAPMEAKVAIICAAIGESTLHALTTPNSAGYWGVLQGGSGQHGSAPNFPNPRDSKGMAESFLLGGKGFQDGGALHLIREGHTDPGYIATEVEKSGEPPEYYGKHSKEAEAIINSGGAGGSSEGEQVPKEYKFERKAGEGTWECAQRLAEEVGWRCFMRYGEMWFMNDLELADSGTPILIDENTPGVVNINWELDKSEKKKPKVTIEARAPMWTVPPGKPVELGEQVGEPVTGLWIVSEIIRKDITDNAVEIVLSKPETPKNEPATTYQKIAPAAIASPSGTVNTSDGTGSGTDPGERQTDNEGELLSSSMAVQLFNQCKWIAEQHFPYVYGGGHAGFYASNPAGNRHPPIPEQAGLDCSGAVSWALHSAGMFNNFIDPLTSGEIALEWGEAGQGRFFTVWANTDHVFIQFEPALCRTTAYTYWAAKHPGTIVGFSSTEEATTNFTPKHWAGL